MPTKPPIIYNINIFVIIAITIGSMGICGGGLYYCFTGTHANKRKINAVVATELDDLDAFIT